MRLVFTGKTKDVYVLDSGKYLLKFKDDVTGADGLFDPGSNTVGFSMEGAGEAALRLTTFFFKLLKKKQIPTHYLASDFQAGTMTVEPATPFGDGLEVICRYRAVGSFYRRYGKYVQEGEPLDAFVEITLKDDVREDPPISKDALVMLGILTSEEYETLVKRTREIGAIVKEELSKRGLELYDLKFEFGRIGGKQQIAIIDEISGGNMRVFKDKVQLEPLQLTELILANH